MSWKWFVVGVQLIILNTTTPGSLRLASTNSSSTGRARSVNVGMMSRCVTTTTPLARTLGPGPSAHAGPATAHAKTIAKHAIAKHALPSIVMAGLLLEFFEVSIGLGGRLLEEEARPLVERRREQRLRVVEERRPDGRGLVGLIRLRTRPALDQGEPIGPAALADGAEVDHAAALETLAREPVHQLLAVIGLLGLELDVDHDVLLLGLGARDSGQAQERWH